MRLARLVATALVLLSLDGSFGQVNKEKDKLPPGWSRLSLSDSQKQELSKLQREHKEAVDKLLRQIAVLDADHVKKRLAILTDEQRKKLREMDAGGKR